MKLLHKNLLSGITSFAAIVAGFSCISGCSKQAAPQPDSNAEAKPQSTSEKFGSETLRILIPEEYLSEDVIHDFENVHKIKIEITSSESNEDMYDKVIAGGKYDIIVPSDYMVERFIAKNTLQPIDKSIVTNLNQLDDAVKNLSFDPDNKYSVPYFWGNVGIVYNKNKVDAEKLKAEGFGIFLDTTYAGQIYWYDDQRDSFMAALKDLGYSMNSTSIEELTKAYTWLVQMETTMKPEFINENVIDNMKEGKKSLAIVYSGDASDILRTNKDMDYFVPEQGTNIWYDCMAIPKNATAPKLANEFINYMLSHDAALKNSKAFAYTSPNAAVAKELSEGEFSAISSYKIRSKFGKDEIYHDNEPNQYVIADLWSKAKDEEEKNKAGAEDKQ